MASASAGALTHGMPSRLSSCCTCSACALVTRVALPAALYTYQRRYASTRYVYHHGVCLSLPDSHCLSRDLSLTLLASLCMRVTSLWSAPPATAAECSAKASAFRCFRSALTRCFSAGDAPSNTNSGLTPCSTIPTVRARNPCTRTQSEVIFRHASEYFRLRVNYRAACDCQCYRAACVCQCYRAASVSTIEAAFGACTRAAAGGCLNVAGGLSLGILQVLCGLRCWLSERRSACSLSRTCPVRTAIRNWYNHIEASIARVRPV